MNAHWDCLCCPEFELRSARRIRAQMSDSTVGSQKHAAPRRVNFLWSTSSDEKKKANDNKEILEGWNNISPASPPPFMGFPLLKRLRAFLSCGVKSDSLFFIYSGMEFCPLNCAFYSVALDSALLLPEVPVPLSKSSSCRGKTQKSSGNRPTRQRSPFNWFKHKWICALRIHFCLNSS